MSELLYVNDDRNTSVTCRENILQLHIIYLDKIELLSNEERQAYTKYLNALNNPIVYVQSDLIVGDI